MGELYYCYTFGYAFHEGGAAVGDNSSSDSYYTATWTMSLQMQLETGYITIATMNLSGTDWRDNYKATFNNHTFQKRIWDYSYPDGYFDGQHVSNGWTYREKAK